MIIDRLILKNFKRFRHQEIRFRDGITGILGNNGTGKSSIVEGIFFALYGVQATGIQADYIVSSYAGPKDKCEVRLDFRVGGEEYTVLRTFKKGKAIQHDASFYRAGKLRASGVSQVAVEVERTLGMGPVDFRNTIYAGQKDLLTLLENTPGKRKEWFLRALGIDYLKTESDRILKARIDVKDRDLQLLDGELRGLTARHDPAALKSLQDLALKKQAALKNLAHAIGDHAARRKEIASRVAEFMEKKNEHTRLLERQRFLESETGDLARQKDRIESQVESLEGQEKEYAVLAQQLSGLEEKKRSLENLKKQRAENDSLSAEKRFVEQECAMLRTRLAKEQSKVDALVADAGRLALLLKEIRDLLHIPPKVPDVDLERTVVSREADLQHTIGNLSGRLAHLVAERKKLAADWNTIREAGEGGRCPLCHQTLGAHFGKIDEEFSSRLEQIQDDALRLKCEHDRLTEEREAITRQKPAFAEIRSISERTKTRGAIEHEMMDLSGQLREKEAAKQTLAAKIHAIAFDPAVCSSMEKEVADLEHYHARFIEIGKVLAHGAALKTQAKDLGQRILEKQDELNQLRLQIEKSGFDSATGQQLDRDLDAAETALRTAEAENARTMEHLRHTQSEIDRLTREDHAIEELKTKKTALEDEIGLLRMTRSLIGEYVIYLMQVVRSRIEGEVSRILNEITGGRYEQVLIDEDFNILIRDIDNDYPVARFSGGEQDDIAVALRIALSRYLAELHQVHESTLLIFDEIFGSQDEERRSNLLSALRTQESRFPQIILISHIPEIQGEFSTTMMVEMGTDLSSVVREVT